MYNAECRRTWDAAEDHGVLAGTVRRDDRGDQLFDERGVLCGMNKMRICSFEDAERVWKSEKSDGCFGSGVSSGGKVR